MNRLINLKYLTTCITSCEHFQHIIQNYFYRTIYIYPDDKTCMPAEFLFNNSKTKIIARSDHWFLLLFKESLAIRRFKH
jgi:hypothetical protein